MWFEILPAFGIMTGALYLGMCSTFWMPQLFLGRQNYRRFGTAARLNYYHRDERLGGDWNPYVMRGLEMIPEEDGKKE